LIAHLRRRIQVQTRKQLVKTNHTTQVQYAYIYKYKTLRQLINYRKKKQASWRRNNCYHFIFVINRSGH